MRYERLSIACKKNHLRVEAVSPDPTVGKYSGPRFDYAIPCAAPFHRRSRPSQSVRPTQRRLDIQGAIGVKSSEDTIAKSLEGDYRPEHLFALQPSLTAFHY